MSYAFTEIHTRHLHRFSQLPVVIGPQRLICWFCVRQQPQLLFSAWQMDGLRRHLWTSCSLMLSLLTNAPSRMAPSSIAQRWSAPRPRALRRRRARLAREQFFSVAVQTDAGLSLEWESAMTAVLQAAINRYFTYPDYPCGLTKSVQVSVQCLFARQLTWLMLSWSLKHDYACDCFVTVIR